MTSPLATVLYEDSKLGKEFPLHHLVLRLVEDEINGQTWRLRKVVHDNPKNGIDKVLADVRATELIAGEGMVFVLVDRDRIVRHVNQNALPNEVPLSPNATDDEIVSALKATTKAASKLGVFLLYENMESLLDAIGACAPGQWKAELAVAKGKDRLARDFVLTEISKAAMTAVRACVRAKQPGIDGLAKALAAIIPPEAIA